MADSASDRQQTTSTVRPRDVTSAAIVARSDQPHHSAAQHRRNGRFVSGHDEGLLVPHVRAVIKALAPADRRPAWQILTHCYPAMDRPHYADPDAAQRITAAAIDPNAPPPIDVDGLPVRLDADQLAALTDAAGFCRRQAALIRRRALDGEPVDAGDLRAMLAWHAKAVTYRNRIVVDALRLIYAIGNRTRVGLDADEKFSIAAIAAMRAVKYFEPGRGAKISTFIARGIKQALISAGQRAARARKHGIEPNVSLDESACADAPPDANPADGLMVRRYRERRESDRAAYLLEKLSGILDTNAAKLTDRETMLIRRRFKLDGGGRSAPRDITDYGALARPLGVSRQRAHHIVRDGLAKLRRLLDEALDGPRKAGSSAA